MLSVIFPPSDSHLSQMSFRYAIWFRSWAGRLRNLLEGAHVFLLRAHESELDVAGSGGVICNFSTSFSGHS